MVDKLWDDWQRRRPENFWAYQGGSVGAHSAPGIYDKFPNGAPPYLGVRFLSHPLTVADLFSFQFGTDVPGDGLLNNAIIFELMDIRAYDFCYTYE
jgi:tyrosinase